MNVLQPYEYDPEKLQTFNGFYNIEHELSNGGVGRGQAIEILRYLHADGRFNEVITRMDSSGSPSECRKFELGEYDS